MAGRLGHSHQSIVSCQAFEFVGVPDKTNNQTVITVGNDVPFSSAKLRSWSPRD